MRNHTSDVMRSIIRGALAAMLLLSFNLLVFAQSELQITPARGFQPSHSYTMTDIETINTTSGNLMLDIPLASLPAGRGGHPGFALALRYNSKIWDGQADTAPDPNRPNVDVDVTWLQLSDEGNWRYNIPRRYHYVIDNRNNHGHIYPESDLRHWYIWKVTMMFPDGSGHEMRPWGINDATGDAYYNVLPASGMSYFSTDGTFARLDIGSNGAWTLNFPDGTQVVNQSDNTQRTYDRLGNFITTQTVTNYNNTGHAADVITDQLNRSLVIEHGTNEDYIHSWGAGGTEIVTTVKWGNTFVDKIYRAGGHFQYDATLKRTIKVVTEIDLPSQLGAGLKYLFGYNGNTATNMGTSVGWGEVSSVTLPSGANCTYKYDMDNKSGPGFPTDWVLENSPTRRDLNYNLEYDNTSVAAPTETWVYGIGDGASGVTGPDGSRTIEWFSPSPNRGRVYKSQRPDGSVVERIWKQNRPWLPSGVTISSAAIVNPFVEDEFFSIPDATGTLVLTSARHYNYDKNGNITQIKDYDWMPYSSVPRDSFGKPTGIPAGAQLKRVTANTYFSDTPDANTASSDLDSYDRSTAPRLLSLLKSSEVGNGSNASSRTEFTYDNILTTGNLTEERSWDSTKAGYSNPLTPSNSIAVSHQYDTFGNRTITTDPRGFQTKLIYGAIGSFTDLYPTQTISAFGTAIQRTLTTEYDFNTGLVTKTTDDNGLANETDYDVFGRVIETRAAANLPALKSATHTEYSNVDRRVITRSDLNAANDGKLVKIQHYDQLGRIRLTRQLEDAGTESATDEATGIKVQTRYFINNPCLPAMLDTCLTANAASLARFRASSTPYRAATSSAAAVNESTTMGWIREKTDTGGRVVENQDFAGGLPAPWGSNTTSTGIVSTSYDGVFKTITDQAGKVRRSMTDSLGRLARVDEPAPDSTNLGPTSAPVQPTSYSYDALNNIVTVSQGSQTRTFVYSSLSRMTSAKMPEAMNSQGTLIATALEYDNNGNLTKKTDPRGVEVVYAYDALNRLTSRNYSDTTPDVTYVYDDPNVANSKGRLTSVSSSVSTYAYTNLDALGRALSVTQTTDGVGYTMNYQYNRAGMVTSKTYPSGRVIASEYDSAGRLAGVKNQANNFFYAGAGSSDSNRINYAAHGAMTTMRLGNGLWEHATFNSRLQQTEIGLGSTSSNSTILKLNYVYGTTNNNGNVQTQTITVPTIGTATGFTAVQTYSYDELNRLSTVSENSSWVQNFDYDRYGNRSFISGTTFPSQLNAANNPAITTNNNRIDPAASGQSNVIYDNSGNLTRDVQGHTFTYDADNKQTTYDGGAAAGGATYFYDANGRRVKKVVGVAAVTTVFVYDVEGSLMAEYSGSGATGGTQYMTGDQLGSPRVVTAADQQVKARHDYAPFGEELPSTLGGRTTDQRYGGQDKLNQKFSGKERDSETGLDYFSARYYSNIQGRFTSNDPMLFAKQKMVDPQQWNGYAYTRNNPVVLSDPTGEYVCTDVKKCAEFEKARQEALKSKDADTVRAAQAYGDPSKKAGDRGDNGVVVRFASQLKDDRGGSVGRRGGGLEQDPNSPNGLRAALDVTIQDDHAGDVEVVAHEGSHVADYQAFANAIQPNGDINGAADALNITHRETETRAYNISIRLALQGNKTQNFGQCGMEKDCKFTPGMMPALKDQRIQDLLNSQYKDLDKKLWPEPTFKQTVP